MGIDAPALSRLETGKMLNPTLATLHKWAEALGQELDVDFLAVINDRQLKNGDEQAMNSAQALQFLDTLWANFRRVGASVDIEQMSHDRREFLIKQNPPARPFIQAAWFSRQGYIISAWSLWEYYSRVFCDGLPKIVARDRHQSCVDWVERSLSANSIPFPRRHWFSGGNALRNLIAHYSGRAIDSAGQRHYRNAKKFAFPDLDLFADNYVNIQKDHVSLIHWEIGEFIRDMDQNPARPESERKGVQIHQSL
jgi:transcriptional regulator with XRE-family HTH domain